MPMTSASKARESQNFPHDVKHADVRLDASRSRGGLGKKAAPIELRELRESHFRNSR